MTTCKQGPAGDCQAEGRTGQGIVGRQCPVCQSEEADAATAAVVVPHILLTLGEPRLSSKDPLIAGLDVGGQDIASLQVNEILDNNDELQTLKIRVFSAENPKSD